MTLSDLLKDKGLQYGAMGGGLTGAALAMAVFGNKRRGYLKPALIGAGLGAAAGGGAGYSLSSYLKADQARYDNQVRHAQEQVAQQEAQQALAEKKKLSGSEAAGGLINLATAPYAAPVTLAMSGLGNTLWDKDDNFKPFNIPSNVIGNTNQVINTRGDNFNPLVQGVKTLADPIGTGLANNKLMADVVSEGGAALFKNYIGDRSVEDKLKKLELAARLRTGRGAATMH